MAYYKAGKALQHPSNATATSSEKRLRSKTAKAITVCQNQSTRKGHS